MEHSPMPVVPPPPQRSSYGPLIGIVLVLAVIVISALYVWGQRIAQEQPQTPTTQSSSR